MASDPLMVTLKDIAAFLKEQSVTFALIGGLAVAIRGEPRSTLDIDLVIDSEVDRALKLVASLGNSRFRPLFSGVEDVVRTALLLPIAHRQTGIKVDLALGVTGFEQAAIDNASNVVIGQEQIPVVTAEHLVIMKQLAARPRDLDDIHKILLRQGESFDWESTLALAEQLGTAVDQDLAGPLTETRRKLDRTGL